MAKPAGLRSSSTTILGVSLLVALVVLSVAVEEAAAQQQSINYDAMGADEVPGKKRALFRPDAVANKYTRGCEKQEQCRD